MIVIVGAGVVGLAIANALARRGRDVVVLERHRRPGLDTSTHNSGVIHAGLYYPAGSLKARLCVEGRARLYAYCAAERIPHHRLGKLVVAADASEEPELERIAATATAAGVPTEIVDAVFVRQREPNVRAVRALWSPETGWVDAHALVRALEHDATSHDVAILCGSPIVGCEPVGDRLRVTTPHEQIDADLVVNAAGLFADDVSRVCGGEAFRIYPCRGEYAELAPRARGLVRSMVYPVPHPSGHGLGVHLATSVHGDVTIGPTIRYQERKDDYEDQRLPLEDFLEPTRQLLPNVTLDDLRLGGSGIRAKLHPPTERFADFLIRRDTIEPRLFHAAGIDSPGLTSSLAIGEFVAAAICDQ